LAVKNKPIVNQENILKRNCNKLKRLYREALEYEEFKKNQKAKELNAMFKSIGEMSITENPSG
jgi:cell fate (sporulation/competence/biofilm development) regulator YmcA (YheA/YmcA/DUF963 family)